MNKNGQFFTPDLVVAVIIFIFGLIMFQVASQTIFLDVTNVNSSTNIDERAHATMEFLVSSTGEPVTWEQNDLIDVNVIGLATSKNILSNSKTEKLIEFMDDNYLETKTMLGLGGLDFNISIVDSTGLVLFESGQLASEPAQRYIYERKTILNGNQVTLIGVFSVEK